MEFSLCSRKKQTYPNIIMKKLAISFILSGLIGLISISLYTGIYLSRIIPLMSLIIFFIYLILGGYIIGLSLYSGGIKTKLTSFILIIISFMISVFSSLELIPLEISIKFQISLIITSFVVIISSFFKGIIRLIILICLLLPSLYYLV